MQNALSKPPAPGNRVINDQHDDGADDGNEHRIEIEAGNPHASDAGKNKPADTGTHNAEHDVQNAAFACRLTIRLATKPVIRPNRIQPTTLIGKLLGSGLNVGVPLTEIKAVTTYKT